MKIKKDSWCIAWFLSVAIMFILFNIYSSAAQIPFSTQPEKQEARSGNKEYQKENYTEAETNYKKALDIRNNMPEATFNLGDAVYKQKRYEDAQKQFQLSAQTNSDPAVKAKAYYNLGNSFLEQKKWEDAIKAYKSALKINPGDQETKYNLAYANAMLQKNGGGQNNQKQDQKDQQDKKDQQKQDQKNQSDQNKDQQQKQQQDQQANNQDQKKQQQQQQGQKPKLSKEDAEKLLAAMENEEQQTTQKMQKKTMKAVKVKIKKDW